MPLASASCTADDNLVDRTFKACAITFLRRKRTELAGEDADVGIVDIAIKNVGRDIAILFLARGAGHDPERIEVIRSVELERFLVGDPLIQIDLLGD